MIKKVGIRVAKGIMETHTRRLQNRDVKLDPFQYWEKSIIQVWIKQLEPQMKRSIYEWERMDVMERKTRDRKKLVEEWMAESNVYDEVKKCTGIIRNNRY